MIKPGKAGTVTLGKLSNLRMVAGQEKNYSRVICNGKVNEWVGIGWIELDVKPDPDKYPVVIDEDEDMASKQTRRENPRSIKNITRFEAERGHNFDGWRVTKQIRGIQFTKYFPDRKRHTSASDPSKLSLRQAKRALREFKMQAAERTPVSLQAWARREGYDVKDTRA